MSSLQNTISHPSAPPCWQQLLPFIKDTTAQKVHSSPGLALLGVSSLSSTDIRGACERFGVLLSFRADFLKSRGVVFVSYYDLRAAQCAATGLRMLPCVLNANNNLPESQPPLFVCYCTPLHYSFNTDESAIIISNLPDDVEEQQVSERALRMTRMLN